MKNLFSLSTLIFHSFHKRYFPNDKSYMILFIIIAWNLLGSCEDQAYLPKYLFGGRNFQSSVSKNMWTSECGGSPGEAPRPQGRQRRPSTPQHEDVQVPFLLRGFRTGFIDKVSKSSSLLNTQAFSVINKLLLFCVILQ